jgi:hypothetical protein
MNSHATLLRQGWLTGLGTILTGVMLIGGLAGCFAIAVGAGAAGTVAYVRGDLTANLSHDYESVFKATDQAVARLEYAKVSENKDALDAVLIARTARDKRIEIRLHKVGEQLTRVQIRIGLFGDEPLSLMILDKIKAAHDQWPEGAR